VLYPFPEAIASVDEFAATARQPTWLDGPHRGHDCRFGNGLSICPLALDPAGSAFDCGDDRQFEQCLSGTGGREFANPALMTEDSERL
jgi:hypothetical protein